MNRRIFLFTPALLLGSKSYSNTITVTGAGATFPAPLYHKWAQEARTQINVNVNYQSIGSGAGINQIKARTVAFGATDAPLSDPDDLYQFPTVSGKVVPIFNIPGIRDVNMTMLVAAQIYSGQITMWNDPKIAQLNPNVNLPRIPIVPIYRADGSGTTFIWTKAMRETADSPWRDVGTSVRWTTGQGARGNEGVASTVMRVRGAFGYVEYIYAKNNNIPFVNMNEYPTGRTFILLPKQPRERAVHDNAVKFFEWCLTQGRNIAEEMHYHNIPVTEAEEIIRTLKSF